MNRDACAALDAADPLAPCRRHFLLPDGIIYLDGNSLGPLPRAVPGTLATMLNQQWGHDLIRSWNQHDWIGAPARVGAKIAPLVGAAAHEVLAVDTVSINIFKLLAAALAMRPGRRAIVSELGNFPTDLYMMQGLHALLPDLDLRMVPRDQVTRVLDQDVAVILLAHVHYKTAERWDMRAITHAAHAAGALALWDLSHSTGAVRVALREAGADFAVGCGYKFLNGGPGAPGFLFVADRHLAQVQNPLSGWLGHAAPFDFTDAYQPAADIRRMMCSSPSIIALTALEAALAAWDGVDTAAVEHKAGQLGDLFIHLTETHCAGLGLTLVSPRNPSTRGAHVSLAHDTAYPVMQALIEAGIIGDFRAPNLLRFGFPPLTTRFTDVFDAVQSLERILREGVFHAPRFSERALVT